MDYYISVHWLESLHRYTFSKRFLLPLFLKRTEKKKYQSRRVSFRLRLLFTFLSLPRYIRSYII